jgi:hypothetical protein
MVEVLLPGLMRDEIDRNIPARQQQRVQRT